MMWRSAEHWWSAATNIISGRLIYWLEGKKHFCNLFLGKISWWFLSDSVKLISCSIYLSLVIFTWSIFAKAQKNYVRIGICNNGN